ncbi:glycosyltransferase [Mesorhizobium sp. B2-5-9]|uniref:glycosyltransferase family 2 protein n=1 Tax=unclassified Mesorhizobium TaxID=325217 RepID=UPI00112D9A7F|nr:MULTISPECIES: glycosyltransferase family 2 protein [unclassified Mesorhizobium]MBZ9684688.1 glycosyltransferase [Mesorhizobium sp. CO1-1-2]MBZ9699257.1 glycosyltransferase [Mesorhizobium sp. CO1-1-9]MBZ9725788.1 glycosyltransferase [Mesorhizobium sp. CO1-1-11]MBZ9928431.1 glycosyltransferase [Mesorhizobium sp. BR1-1-4]TPK02250.1 glycosyltransferase [Mesorhizobium sp. B2-5-9]
MGMEFNRRIGTSDANDAPNISAGAPVISIVIATHNRSHDVLENVNALLPQCVGQPVEVIVIDSASAPAHAEVLEDLRGRDGLSLIRLDKPGVALARNAGFEAGRGEWIALLDDDAVPRAGWVEAAITCAARCDVHTAILAGRVIPHWPDNAGSLEMPPSSLGPRARLLLSVVDEDGFVDTTHHPIGVGANMLFRRSALDALGGFDVTTGRVGSNLASGEEAQMMTDLIAAGYRCWYSDAFVVDHKVHAGRLTRAWLTERARKEGEVELRSLKTRSQRIARALKMLIATPPLAVLQIRDRPEREYYLRLNHNLGLLRRVLGWAS